MGCANSKPHRRTGDIDDDFKGYSKYKVKPAPPARPKSVKFDASNVRRSSRNANKRPAPRPPGNNANTRSDVKPTAHEENAYSNPPTTEGSKSDDKQISISKSDDTEKRDQQNRSNPSIKNVKVGGDSDTVLELPPINSSSKVKVSSILHHIHITYAKHKTHSVVTLYVCTTDTSQMFQDTKTPPPLSISPRVTEPSSSVAYRIDWKSLVAATQRNNLEMMREDLQTNLKRFVVNQLLMSIQFFDNFERWVHYHEWS